MRSRYNGTSHTLAEVTRSDEHRQWAQYNVATTERYYRYKAYAAATARATEQERQIYKFKTRSIYLDMFQIVVDENVGIINGLQMGKGNGSAIDWQEVNTAWGIVVLLVQTICKARQYTSTQYGICNMDTLKYSYHPDLGISCILTEHSQGYMSVQGSTKYSMSYMVRAIPNLVASSSTVNSIKVWSRSWLCLMSSRSV